MYNGIGLQTARGSGTNGHVQRNWALVKPREKEKTYRTEQDLAALDAAANRQPNKEILDHERKRKIELKCAEFAEMLEDQGFSEEAISNKVNNYRTMLNGQDGGKLDKPVDEWGRTCVTETHQVAEAQQEKNQRLREAFGISEYFVDGSSFDPDRSAKEKLAKSEALAEKEKQRVLAQESSAENSKRYHLVHTPSPEPDNTKQQSAEKSKKKKRKHRDSSSSDEPKKKKKKSKSRKKDRKAKEKKKRRKQRQSSASSEDDSKSDSSEDTSSEDEKRRKKLKKKERKKSAKKKRGTSSDSDRDSSPEVNKKKPKDGKPKEERLRKDKARTKDSKERRKGKDEDKQSANKQGDARKSRSPRRHDDRKQKHDEENTRRRKRSRSQTKEDKSSKTRARRDYDEERTNRRDYDDNKYSGRRDVEDRDDKFNNKQAEDGLDRYSTRRDLEDRNQRQKRSLSRHNYADDKEQRYKSRSPLRRRSKSREKRRKSKTPSPKYKRKRSTTPVKKTNNSDKRDFSPKRRNLSPKRSTSPSNDHSRAKEVRSARSTTPAQHKAQDKPKQTPVVRLRRASSSEEDVSDKEYPREDIIDEKEMRMLRLLKSGLAAKAKDSLERKKTIVKSVVHASPTKIEPDNFDIKVLPLKRDDLTSVHVAKDVAKDSNGRSRSRSLSKDNKQIVGKKRASRSSSQSSASSKRSRSSSSSSHSSRSRSRTKSRSRSRSHSSSSSSSSTTSSNSSRSRSPSIPRRHGSPSFLDRRRITRHR